jgi:hypothetical protein
MPRGALRRNGIFASFFEAEASRLAEARHEMSRRLLAGGRLKDGIRCVGRGAYNPSRVWSCRRVWQVWSRCWKLFSRMEHFAR